MFDVTGYFLDDASGATYVPLAPARVLDTRDGTGLQRPVRRPQPADLPGRRWGGVPVTAVAVTGNLTVTEQTHLGFVSLGPDPVVNPTTSTLNFPVGDNRANGVTVALDATGDLSAIYGAAGGASTHLIFDVTGYFLDDASGASYVPLSPARLLDTRFGIGLSGPFFAHVPRTLPGRRPGRGAGHRGSGHRQPDRHRADHLGFASLGPDPVVHPTTSTLNFPVGDNRANGVTVALGTGLQLSMVQATTGCGCLSATYGAVDGASTHLIFDVTGYFIGP